MDPIPVHPLEYKQDAETSWLPVVKLTAWGGMAFGGMQLVQNAVDAIPALMRTRAVFWNAGLVNSVATVLPLLSLVASALLLAASIWCINLVANARRLFIAASLSMAGTLALTGIMRSVLYFNRYSSVYSSPVSSAFTLTVLLSTARTMVLPVLLAALMMHRSARRVFGELD